MASAQHILEEADVKGSAKLKYSEFLAATMEVKDVLNQEVLAILFRDFDQENKGFVTAEDI